MSIEVVCQCGQSYKLKDQFSGKRVRCKQCSAIIQIPSTDIAGDEPQALQAREANPTTDPEYLRKKRIEYAAAGVSRSPSSKTASLIRFIETYLPFPILPQRVPYRVRVAGGKAPAVPLTSDGIRELIMSGDINLSTKVSHPDWKNGSGPEVTVWKELRDIVSKEYQLEVLYRPFLAHVRRGARWLAIAAGIVMFPAILILALMHTVLSYTEDNSLLKGAAMLVFAPIYLPVLFNVAVGVGVCAANGAIYGAMIGLARSPFLPRAPENFKPA